MKKLRLILASFSILTFSATIAQAQQVVSNEKKVTAEPLTGRAAKIPVLPATAVLSFTPIVLPAPGRAVDLQVRVTAPATGNKLPVIILSHGHGNSNNLSSMNGYAPLVNFWAAHGFIVIQPTHLDSKSLQLNSMNRENPLFWRSRGKLECK